MQGSEFGLQSPKSGVGIRAGWGANMVTHAYKPELRKERGRTLGLAGQPAQPNLLILVQ